MNQLFNLENFLTSHQPKNGRFFTIAIDGRGGSGKSSLVEYLKPLLLDFTMLNGDDYFEPVENQIVWGDFNDGRFVADVIDPLKNGDSFTYRPYDWHTDPHITEKIVTVQKGFCLERVSSFSFDLDWDLKIWVETPPEICLERGIAREMMPRERVLGAWKIWQGQEDEYIRTQQPMEKADIVLDGTKAFEEQIG